MEVKRARDLQRGDVVTDFRTGMVSVVKDVTIEPQHQTILIYYTDGNATRVPIETEMGTQSYKNGSKYHAQRRDHPCPECDGVGWTCVRCNNKGSMCVCNRAAQDAYDCQACEGTGEADCPQP